MKKLTGNLTVIFLVAGLALTAGSADKPAPNELTLDECVKIALKQNPAVLKARQELERTRGLVMESRSGTMPRLSITGQYATSDQSSSQNTSSNAAMQNSQTLSGIGPYQENPWVTQIEASQALYTGGRVSSSVRSARLADEIAGSRLRQAEADIIFEVRRAFYQVLLNTAQVNVREQSIKLLEQEVQDARKKLDSGTVPRFNVLRVEVEMANARPPLIRAQNGLRLSRESLVKLLALETASSNTGFTEMNFTGSLGYKHVDWQVGDALSKARAARPELAASKEQVDRATEQIAAAQAGYKPDIALFGNYGIGNTTPFATESDGTLSTWTAGVRASWPLFEGMFTRAKVIQARAILEQAKLDLDDTKRNIELEVRRSYSDYLQALELIESQKKTVEQAEESLRLAEAQFRAGTGTQLDVLSAQTALTETRSNSIQALYEYNTAIANLERVTGTTTNPAK
jgi:outer membrane protein